MQLNRRIMTVLIIGLILGVFLVGFVKILNEIKDLVKEYCVNTYREKVNVSPSQFGMQDFDQLKVEVEEGIFLQGWLIPGLKKNPVVVLIPGYQGTRKTMLPYAQFLYRAGYTTFLYDPRGQGESDGDCICGSYLAEDLGKIINTLKEVGYSKFVLFGLSLGAVGAIIAGSQNPEVIGVIADSGFANMREGLRKSPLFFARLLFDNPILYSLLSYFGRLYLYNYFKVWINPFERTNALNCVDKVRNILIIHAKEDQLISVNNAIMLFDKAKSGKNGVKELWVVQNSAHCENFFRHPKQYQQKILNFLKKVEGL